MSEMFTSVGNIIPIIAASRFIDGNDYHFVTMRDNDDMMVYDAGVYEMYGISYLKEAIQKITRGNGINTHSVNEIVQHIKRSTYTNRDAFDTNPRIINMENGLYSLDTGMSPHDPKYLSLHKSPIRYDADATCPNIDKFIREIVPPEYVETIYEICGYAMTPHKTLKTAVIFIGAENSGRTVLLKLIGKLVSGHAISNVTPSTVLDTTFGGADYYGKQLNIIDDLGNAPISDTGLLKSVITGASIDAQFKYGQQFKYTPDVLCVFAANEVPKVEPFDNAFASRFSIIPCPNRFEGDSADPTLIDKLTTPEELSGFFNKCMDALIRLEDTNTFTNAVSLADRIKAYKYHANPVEQFIDEICTLEDKDDYVLKDDLYNQYVLWSRDNDIRVEDKRFLTMSLDKRGCKSMKKTIDDGRPYVYVGVRLKSGLGDY